MNDRVRQQRGLTLTEVAVVIVLASVVMTGLVVFYLNSQANWMDAAAQAITQREATLVLDAVRDRARGADTAYCDAGGLHLGYGMPVDSIFTFQLHADSLIYQSGSGPIGTTAPAAILQSRVESFQVATTPLTVEIQQLTLHSAEGDRITMSTTVRLVNGSRK